MKYLKIFLSIMIIIILGIYLFYTNSISVYERFQETQTTTNSLFNIKSIIEDPSTDVVCSLKTYRYPEQGNNQEIQKNIIRYIMDSNLYQLSQLEAFTIMYQKDLIELHSKTFYGGVNLINVNLMGCGKHDITNKNVGIEVFSSNLFLNNLGKRKPNGKRPNPENHYFALNLYEEIDETGNYIELPIDKKKKVIVYPETILRLTTLYPELLDGVNATNPSSTTSASGSSSTITLDQIINSNIIDNNIYNFLYEKSMNNNDFRVLLFRVFGIEEDLFDNTNMTNDIFKIVKTGVKTTPSCPRDEETYCYYEDLVTNCGSFSSESNVTDYSINVIRNNFRFVYYKDVMFSTDVAFWRTNIYNEMNTTPSTIQSSGTTQALSIPQHINKFTVFSSVEGQRENIVSLLLKISQYNHQIKNLVNLNKYGNLGNEVIIKKNRDILRDKIQHFNGLIFNYTIIDVDDSTLEPTPATRGELINLDEIVRNGINSMGSGCDGCDEIKPKINQNGEIVPPLNFDVPNYVKNIYPPYPTVETPECSMTTPACVEQFNSCNCQTYKLSYNFNGKTENVYILIDGIIDINNFSSMYTSSEAERFRLLKLNIELFNPFTPVNAGQKFIEYANLFHNIPTQIEYISSIQ